MNLIILILGLVKSGIFYDNQLLFNKQFIVNINLNSKYLLINVKNYRLIIYRNAIVSTP